MFNIHLKNPNSYLMLLADVAMVSLALVGAYALRFDFFSDPVFLEGRYDTQLIRALAVVVPYKMVIFGLFGLYRGMWRYTNLRDMRKLAVAVMLSSMLMVSYIAYRYHFVGFCPQCLRVGCAVDLCAGGRSAHFHSHWVRLSPVRVGWSHAQTIAAAPATDAGDRGGV